ncbi:hypothetical protein EBS80_04565 [bacterium]|nr:hypothetical protein [bacterium]
MKKLLATLTLLSLVGFGCIVDKAPVPVASDTTYVNAQYGFSLDHTKDVEMKDRDEKNRATKYLGLDVDFFTSIRDTVREAKPVNLAFVYAAPGLTADAFSAALVASDPTGAVTVKLAEDVAMGDVTMKKITSTTQVGTDKIHYLWDDHGTTIVFSVFIGENAEFDAILGTLKTL